VDVPAGGMATYEIVEGEGAMPVLPDQRTVGQSWDEDLVFVATSQLSVGLDSGTGAIRSLVHLSSGRELVRQDGGSDEEGSLSGLNQYLYVPGRDPTMVVTNGPASVRIVEDGPLVWSLEATSSGPGLRGPLVTEVRMVEGLSRVDIVNSLPKAWVLEPEAVLFGFPFDLVEPEVWIDAPFGSFRPEVDQLPGASKNYMATQRWVDLSSRDLGVTVATLDAPLIQLGEIRTDPIVYGWLETIDPSATLYSYVMNNYWETNYRAAQDDELALRYSLGLHEEFHADEAHRFGLEHARPLIHRVTRR